MRGPESQGKIKEGSGRSRVIWWKPGVALSACAVLAGICGVQADTYRAHAPRYESATFTITDGQASPLGAIVTHANDHLASVAGNNHKNSFVQSTNHLLLTGFRTQTSSGQAAPSEDGLPVRVPIPSIIPKCENVVPPVAMVAIINQETHGYPYEIYNNTLERSYTYPTYQAAVAAGQAFRDHNDSVDEGITQVNSIYHPQYSSAYLFHACGGIHAGAAVLAETWNQYANATPNPVMNAYLAIYHYNGNVQSSKCYGEEALQSIGINLGIHECSGATSQQGHTPEILKISGSAQYQAESTPVSDTGILSTGDLNELHFANQQLVQNPEAPSAPSATITPPTKPSSVSTSKHIGTKDLILLLVLAILFALFLFFTGGLGWLASAGLGAAANSALGAIGSATAGAARKAAQIARGMGGGG
jgi:hypothetical protein